MIRYIAPIAIAVSACTYFIYPCFSQTAKAMSTFALGSEVPNIQYESAGGKAASLEPLFGKSRIVLLFLPNGAENEAEGYLHHFADSDQALVDRDLEFIVIPPEGSDLLKKDFGYSFWSEKIDR